MPDKVAIANAKVLRGNIIEKLYSFYGEDITLATLKSVLRYSAYGSNLETDIKKAMYYLGGAKKEYVKLVLNEENYMDSKVWLTPTGVNLAEGDIQDIGVEIDE